MPRTGYWDIADFLEGGNGTLANDQAGDRASEQAFESGQEIETPVV
jgi:hypothetical protein